MSRVNFCKLRNLFAVNLQLTASALLMPCRVGTNRFSFLLESLADLNESFKARGSRLLIVHGDPPEVVPKLIKVCTSI